MSKFQKKQGKASPEVSTASLPDIIFMLLFFFMVVTVLRDGELMVKVTTPQASELTKLERKSLVNTVYIGRPTKKYEGTYGTAPQVQLGDKFAKPREVRAFIEQHRVSVPENQHGSITSSLKIDGDVTMGIVTDVKIELRKAGQLKVNYSAKPK